jgi:hypothetical protein
MLHFSDNRDGLHYDHNLSSGIDRRRICLRTFQSGTGAQMLKDNRLEAEEFELRENAPDHQRALTIAMLIFSLGFCALVFSAGWKEISAYEECGLRGVLTVGRPCPPARSLAKGPSTVRQDF